MDAPTQSPAPPQPTTDGGYARIARLAGWAWVVGTILFLLVVFLGFGYGDGWIR